MPEATVDEDRDPGWTEHDVGATLHAKDGSPIDPVAQATTMQCPPQIELRGRVALALSPEPL